LVLKQKGFGHSPEGTGAEGLVTREEHSLPRGTVAFGETREDGTSGKSGGGPYVEKRQWGWKERHENVKKNKEENRLNRPPAHRRGGKEGLRVKICVESASKVPM